MPMPAMVDNWETFNHLARETLQYDPMSRRELLDSFIEMEYLIFRAVDYLLHTTTFVEDNLCYVLSEISSGIIKSRKIYKGKRVRNRVNVDDDGTVEMGAENKRILGIGFDLFKLSRMSRDKAVPYIKRIIRTMRISTGTYENMLIAFSKECSQYCDVSDKLAELTLELDQLENDPLKGDHDRAELLRQMGNCIDNMNLMELNVGCCEPNFLYGTVRVVDKILKRLRVLQQRVLKAYSRLILKPVREKARSEMEAFDLYQSGNFGLSRAISLYDVRSGTSFPVFANWWIRQRIFGSTKHSSPLIKLPGSVWEMAQKIKAAERKLETDPEKRYNYTTQDIANTMGISVSSIEQVLKKIQSTKVVPLESLVHSGEDGYDDETSIDKALLDDRLDEETAYDDRREFVEKILKHVDKPHRNLICLRYGVIDNVDNSELDSKQVVKEIFRQIACKAVVQGTTAGASDNIGWSTQFETLAD